MPYTKKNLAVQYLIHSFKILLLFLLMRIPNSLYAAPCYGPNMPEKGKWELGTEINILFERELEKDYGEFEGNQYFFTFAYGLMDWFSIDGKLGSGNITQKPEGQDEIKYNINFSGAYGFRIRAFENEAKKIRVIAGFQHISVHPNHRDVDGEDNDCLTDDWQISFLLSKDFKPISPYLGFKISRHDLVHKAAGERKRKKSDDSFGLFIGLDAYLNDRLRLNLEGRFIDETALSTALIYKF